MIELPGIRQAVAIGIAGEEIGHRLAICDAHGEGDLAQCNAPRIALRHASVRELGISCSTNQAAGLSPTPLHHGEVQEIADRTRGRFVALLRAFLRRLAQGEGG